MTNDECQNEELSAYYANLPSSIDCTLEAIPTGSQSLPLIKLYSTEQYDKDLGSYGLISVTCRAGGTELV